MGHADTSRENQGQQVHIIGVVQHLELEGGFYAIRGADSVTYDPRNLPAEFQKDGLSVEADARRRNDVMGIHQVGVIVDPGAHSSSLTMGKPTGDERTIAVDQSNT